MDVSQESHRKRLCSCIKFIRSNAEEIDFEEIAITSSFNLYSVTKDEKGFALEDVKNVIVVVNKNKGSKCQRCWKYSETLVNDEICNRCHETIL